MTHRGSHSQFSIITVYSDSVYKRQYITTTTVYTVIVTSARGEPYIPSALFLTKISFNNFSAYPTYLFKFVVECIFLDFVRNILVKNLIRYYENSLLIKGLPGDNFR